MNEASGTTIDVLVPVFDSVEGVDQTLKSLRAQRHRGIDLSVTVFVSSSEYEALNRLPAVRTFRVVESDAVSHGDMLQEAVADGRADLVAIVSPGESLSARALATMALALHADPSADMACIPSRPADILLDPPFIPAPDVDWPEKTTVRDVRTTWWSARPSFRGTLVRRNALPVTFDVTASGRSAEYEALMRIQSHNSHVAFVTGELVRMHCADEYQSRLFAGSRDVRWYTESIGTHLTRWVSACVGPEGVEPFAQGMALLAIAGRFRANANNLTKNVVTGPDLERFFESCAALLVLVDDAMLLDPDSRSKIGLGSAIALTMYLIKHSGDEVSYALGDCDQAEPGGRRARCLSVCGHAFERTEDQTVRVGLIDYDEATGELIVDGRVRGLAWMAGARYFARLSVVAPDGVELSPVELPLQHRDWYALGKYFGVSTTKAFAFRVRIPIPKDFRTLDIAFTCEPGRSEPMKLSFASHYSRIARHPRRAWWAFGDHYMYHRLKRIVVKPRSVPGILLCESVLLLSLLQGSKLENRRPYNRRAAAQRIAYWLTYPVFARSPHWFFVDKVYKAGDSSEYLYRYASAQRDGIHKDYVVSRSVADYARLGRDGYKPLKAGTLRHLLAFLHADLVFASNSAVGALNGLKAWRSAPFRGLIHSDTVCVQHGLSVQNIAVAQNRLVDNTRLYLLASPVELANLSKPIYAYDDYPEALQLTGIPRYDGLVPDDRKQILIHPTWRMQFAMPVLTHEGEGRPYNPAFKDSPYFTTYSSLISNEKFIQCAEETGYSIKYVLHPIASSQLRDFPNSGPVEILGASGELDYEQVLTQSSLMVTDYSGVQFDFAYMRKPVLYYHPPELPPHYTVSAFDYSTMAFGEVCPDERHLVDLLCEYMRAGCRIKPEYSERVDRFFAFDDRRNCERSYLAASQYMRVRNERR